VREVGRAEHASTEQLSALLDGRAEPDERAFLAGHVDGCVVCSNELSGLRSVQDLLRALPVYLPPRSFTIPSERARPARWFRRLIPITRALAAVAAMLCVVLVSVDAMRTEYDAPTAIPNGAGAMRITTQPTQGSAGAAREAARPADTTSKIAGAPAASPAAAPQPAAAQAAPPGPRPTAASFAPGQPVVAPTSPAPPGPAAGQAASAQRPSAPTTAPSPWLAPIRLWSLAFALIAATLLIASLGLGRLARTGRGPQDGWTRR
jgi:hypothetical protein